MRRFKPFIPNDRGRVADPAGAQPLQSVRPLSYLLGVRLQAPVDQHPSVRGPSARDHALFETLLSAARQQSSEASDRSNTINMSALLAVSGGRIRAREIASTLARLRTLRASFPHGKKEDDFPALEFASVENGVVQYRFAPEILSAFGSQAIRAGYRYLDLHTLWRFRSGFSAPFYRYIVGSHYPADAIPKIVVFELSLDRIAAVVGLKMQSSGGWRSQVVNSVIEPFMNAFNSQKGLDPSERDFPFIEIATDTMTSARQTMKFTLHFPLPALARLKSSQIGGGREYTGSIPRLPSASRLQIARADAAALRVSLSTWLKIDHMYKLGVLKIEQLSLAFDYAIDEMINANHPRYGKLTEQAPHRRCRQSRLRLLIFRVGIDRAACLFAVEEMESPDLFDPAIQTALVFDRTRSFVRKSRLQRVKAGDFSLETFVPQDTIKRVPKLSAEEMVVTIAEERAVHQKWAEKARLAEDERKIAKARIVRDRKDRHNLSRRKSRREDAVLKAAFKKSDFLRQSTIVTSRRTPKRQYLSENFDEIGDDYQPSNTDE